MARRKTVRLSNIALVLTTVLQRTDARKRGGTGSAGHKSFQPSKLSLAALIWPLKLSIRHAAKKWTMDAVMGNWEHFGVFSFQLATVINNYNSNLMTGRNFSVFPIKREGQLRSQIQLRWRRDQHHRFYPT